MRYVIDLPQRHQLLVTMAPFLASLAPSDLAAIDRVLAQSISSPSSYTSESYSLGWHLDLLWWTRRANKALAAAHPHADRNLLARLHNAIHLYIHGVLAPAGSASTIHELCVPYASVVNVVTATRTQPARPLASTIPA